MKCCLLSIQWSLAQVDVSCSRGGTGVKGWSDSGAETATAPARETRTTCSVGIFMQFYSPRRMFHPLLPYIPLKFLRAFLLGTVRSHTLYDCSADFHKQLL